MKRFERRSQIWLATTVLVATIFLVGGWATAQTEPLKARLDFTKETYSLDDPNEQISAVILLQNTTGSAVWTQEGFSDLGFHFYLFFYGPEGKDANLITSASSQIGGSDITPSVPPPKVNAELIGANWAIRVDMPEVREYYPLNQPGQYKVWFAMTFVQYDETQAEPGPDEDGDGYADRYFVPWDAVVWQGPIEFKETYITLTRAPAVTSDVRVRAREFIFGEGSHPGVTKRPLEDADVRLYLRSRCEQFYTPINHKTCGAIATDSRIGCVNAEAVEGKPGEYLFRDVEQDDCVIILHASGATDYKHLWSPIDANDPNWDNGEIRKNLILMTDKRGKKSAGKSKKVKGSELLIIEPEYVEWTSSEELYPFALESLGDWDVQVAVEPPEGFLADHDALSQTVQSDLKAVQFTITDVGSKWKPTKIKYKVKHKGKTTHIDSEVNVKLSRKLAKKKGVGVWGEEEKEKKNK